MEVCQPKYVGGTTAAQIHREISARLGEFSNVILPYKSGGEALENAVKKLTSLRKHSPWSCNPCNLRSMSGGTVTT